MNAKNKIPKDNLLIDDLRILERYIEEFWAFLPIPAVVISPTFTVLNVSKKFEEFSGYKESEIVGENFKKFFKNSEKIWSELLKKETISDREMNFLSKRKKEIPINASAKARKDETGEYIGYFFAFVDLTEIKEKEKELREKVEELEVFNKLAVGRELKMIKLKEEIKELKAQLEKKRYE